MKKIVFISTNSIEKDTRIKKEIDALPEYEIIWLAWDRHGKKLGINKAMDDRIHSYELQMKEYNKFKILLVFYLPIWWMYISFFLLFKKYNFIHCLNYDTILPALVFGKIRRKKIIYELLDIHELGDFVSDKNRNFFLKIDKFFMKHSDGVIIVDDEVIDGINGIPNDNICVIFDSPPTKFINNSDENIKIDKSNFNIFYAGWFNKKRRLNIDKLLDAIIDIDNVKLNIAGVGDLSEYIKNEKYEKKINYIGILPYSSVFKYGTQMDLFFVLRDSNILENQYICGSTIFNSMLCKKPLIVNFNTSTTKKVIKAQCGVKVHEDSISEIRNAIINLKNDKDKIRKMGRNGHNYYKNNFSWDIMSSRLNEFYEEMV